METRTHRQQAAEATKERLISIAWDIVRREGPAALTLRRLANDADVAVGLPNLHFGTREGLIDALRIRAWDALDGRTDGELGPFPDAHGEGTDYEALIRRGFETAARFAVEEPRLYALLTPAPGQRLSDDVLLREVQTARRLVALLVRGAETGQLRAQEDPIAVALAFWSSVQGAIARMQVRGHPLVEQYNARVLAEVLDTFFARLRAPRREEQGR
jgi:AcrR family transcriptional regulator